MSACVLFCIAACGGSKASGPSTGTVDTVELTALTPKQLETFCTELLPTIRTATTATRQCTLQALSSAAVDAASCKKAQQSCLDTKAYDDWSKAACADFSMDAGVVTPHFDCHTKVSDVSACFDDVATWLAALSCTAAGTATDKSGSPPVCFTELQTGDCKFAIDALLKNTDFRAPETAPASAFCKSPDGNVDYDLGVGDACNACATSHCCDSYVACLSDTACSCYIGCPGEKTSCYKMCSISDDPPQFTDHYTCILDSCDTECAALFSN